MSDFEITTSPLLIVSPRGYARPEVVARVHSALSPVFGETVHCEMPDADVAPAGTVVVIDGWGSLSINEAVQVCQERFPFCGITVLFADGALGEGTSHLAPPSEFQARLRECQVVCLRWPVTARELIVGVGASVPTALVPSGALVTVDATHMIVECDGVVAHLTETEFALARHLIRQWPRRCTSRELMSVALRTPQRDTTAVRAHIHSLRRKLRHEGWRVRFQNGVGYGFDLGAHVADNPLSLPAQSYAAVSFACSSDSGAADARSNR